MNSFSKAFLALFVLLLAVAASFALVIDPYALFDTPRMEGVNRFKPLGLRHIRLSKAYRVNGAEYEVLILGSSRTGRGLNCDMLSDRARSCYNASSTAATPLESLRYLQQLKPRTVYLGLDLFTVIEAPLVNASFVDDRLRLDAAGDINYRSYQQWITDHFGALVSWQVLDHSRITLRSQGNAMFLPTSDGMPFIRSDGSWGEDPTRLLARGESARGRNQERRFLHIYRVMSLMFHRTQVYHDTHDLPITATIDAHLEALRKIVAYCHDNDIQLTVFFNASHAYYWQLAYRELGRPVLDYWKRNVLNINQSVAGQRDRQPFPLHDFSGINRIAIQEVPSAANGYQLADRFQDPMHYSSDIGQRMLDRMGRGCTAPAAEDWGACLARETISAHLQAQWQRYASFKRQNAAAIARFDRRAMAQSVPAG